VEKPLLSPRCLAGRKPAGLALELPWTGKALGFTKKELNTFTILSTGHVRDSLLEDQDNFESKIHKIHKDLLKILSEF
jgi:hypothetical protein